MDMLHSKIYLIIYIKRTAQQRAQGRFQCTSRKRKKKRENNAALRSASAGNVNTERYGKIPDGWL